MNSFYSPSELEKIGFRSYGENVKVSRKSSIYCAEKIDLGNNVRIDDFVILSGRIVIGDYVHISAGSLLYGGDSGIEMKDYSCVSSRCAIYTISDDYSGKYMTNSTVPDTYKNVTSKTVILEKHVLVGSGCTILPGVIIGEGTSVGCMSLINKSLSPWGIYCGIPCRKIKERSKLLLNYEKELNKI